MVKNNKLVRDKIPAIMKAAGATPVFRRLKSSQEIHHAFCNKMLEEVKELKASTNLYDVLVELGDLLEVIDAYIDHARVPKRELKRLRKQKRRTHGAFDRKIFLTSGGA